MWHMDTYIYECVCRCVCVCVCARVIYIYIYIYYNYTVKDSVIVDEWIIVYDGNETEANPNIFHGSNKTKEYVYRREGISGNPQRHYAVL